MRLSATLGSSRCRTSDQLLAELKTPASEADRPVARAHRAAARPSSATRTSACRPSSTSPAPTARARSPPISRRCWRRPGGACTSTPRRISCASTSASSSPAPTASARADRRGRTGRRAGARRSGQRRRRRSPTSRSPRRRPSSPSPRQPADALLLEVGLGGRLDATNVIARPALTSSRRSRWTMPTSSATRSPRSPARRPAS